MYLHFIQVLFSGHMPLQAISLTFQSADNKDNKRVGELSGIKLKNGLSLVKLEKHQEK